MQSVIELCQPWWILMLTLAANTPDHESAIDDLHSEFCDLHSYADITAEEH